jgi:hypothetical protein
MDWQPCKRTHDRFPTRKKGTMDQLGKMMGGGGGLGDMVKGAAGGAVGQQAVGMIDKVVDEAVNLIVQHFPQAGSQADDAKQQIKNVVQQQITRLTS